jgi:DNA-damage-inducible protein J
MRRISTVQARIEPNLKLKADLILKKVGLTPSQAINALYAQIVLQKGIPFEIKIPNKQTQEAIKELSQGKGTSYDNFQEMINDLDDDD